MKINILIIFVIFKLFLPSESYSDELYIGFDECISNAETTGQEYVCWSNQVKYIKPKVDKLYNEAKESCKSKIHTRQCLSQLKRIKEGRVEYSDNKQTELKGEFIKELDTYPMMNRLEAKQFEAESLQRQYNLFLQWKQKNF